MTPGPADLAREDWDFLVVGTGMGGATLGHALARAGRKVLFLEKGSDLAVNQEALKGGFLESFVPRQEERTSPVWRNAGRSEQSIFDVRQGRWVRPLLGVGTGGSSALYGMVMERFWPEDFEPRRHHPQSPDSTLPDRWPFSFKDLEPFYEDAEKLYGVTCSSPDPLRKNQSFRYLPSPDHDPKGARFHRLLTKKGLHPYRLPLALEWVDECRFCQGYLCDRNCKNDSAKICLTPALRGGSAALVANAEVLSLESDHRRVTGVRTLVGKEVVTFKARRVVLAAGGLWTPLLLLRSRSDLWREGVANRSGLVGRNLMRHYIDIVAVLSRSRFPPTTSLKELAFNDFYCGPHGKLGTAGAFGHMPPSLMIMEDIENDLAANGRPWVNKIFRWGRPVMERVITRVLEHAGYLALILEDLPFKDNRVYWREGSGGPHPAVDYVIRSEEWDRIRLFRRLVRRGLFPNPTLLFAQADNIKFLAHVSGTCRAGDDPRSSVVNAWGKAHDLDNLWICDGSVFPSAGGANPALTIAANALRTAEHLRRLPT